MVQLIKYSELLTLLFITLLLLNETKFIFCSQGKFEIHINNYSVFSPLNLTKCCLNANSTMSCPQNCNIFMEICLSIYQKNPHRYSCDIGEDVILTDILGNDKLNESAKRDYSILVRERWKPNFNILVKIKHKRPFNTGATTMLTLSSSEESVEPSSSWITKQLSTPRDHFHLQVSFRFICSKDYYGKECDIFCKPSANDRGYYNCSSDGERICHVGYNGSFCDEVVCNKKCIHGTCVSPNQCRCLTGWGGEICDKCIPYPGCIHGSCRYDEKRKEFIPLTCQCKKKWGGMFCNIDLNYCSNNRNVCGNGGECENFGNIQTNQQYRCNCKAGFKGTHCEKVESNCSIRECLNNGTCEINPKSNQSKCVCQDSFYGDRCQFNQTSCDDNPCLGSNSSCYPDPKTGFQCKCGKGFSGRNCEIDEDECLTKPCLNGGMCIDRPSEYLCACPVGFSGNNCQVNKNDCQKLSCMNGAKCMDRANRIDCECTAGWTGKMCDQNINECAMNQPCLNDGKCIDTPGSYKCLCQLTWSGRHCDLKIMNPTNDPKVKKCFINPCRNNAICYLSSETMNTESQNGDFLKSIGGQFTCKCRPGFTGDFCEHVIIGNGSVEVFNEYLSTTYPFTFSKSTNNRPLTLILLIIIAIGVPAIIVIIVSFLCCAKCQIYRKSKSDYEMNCKNGNIIERTNIKILNNKWQCNQLGVCDSNNEKIPLAFTRMNNELSKNNHTDLLYQCSHSKKLSDLPLYNYCHIFPNSQNVFSSMKKYKGNPEYSNIFALKCQSVNKKRDEDKYFHKSLSSIKDGEPESQYHKPSFNKSDNENCKESLDLDNHDKLNKKTFKGFNSEMLGRKINNQMAVDLCSSHNSLLDGQIKQNLRNLPNN